MDNITRTILYLEQENIIPKSGIFSITEEILRKYIETYSIFSEGNGKFSFSFARKLAALTFMKINRQRGGTYKTIPEGFIYVITNKAWEDRFKVGMTIEVEDRLKSYQTYSPHRDYKLSRYAFVQDRRKVERELLNSVPEYESEWLNISSKHLIDDIFNRYSSMKK